MSSQQYDVFLSFHGEDTRFGFSGHLWKALDDKGIHTFMDDQLLEKGEEISPLFFKAIEQSRTAIIVLSGNYANLSSCLEELSNILSCIKDKGRSVWPVFYGVEPSEVRHQTGPYVKAFRIHEERSRVNIEKVDKWRKALTQVSSLTGWDFRQGNQYEYQVIHDIVEEVTKKLDRSPLLNTDYVVGIESQLQEVLPLLELESESDVALMVGIYGAAGIGKTTLARKTYNMIANQFEASCFLPNVRENSRGHGLAHLQNMLLSEMIGKKDSNLTNVDRGALRIKNRLHLKKVLLIIDDVDTLEQLEALAGKLDWFGPGSRIIVTTQDRHLLAFHEVERTYEVQPLNHIDSLELLSHQVFKQGNVDPSYKEILNEFVSYASGFPLALKVIGSRLFGKSVEEWTNALHQFKRIPPNEIQKTLKTSFDALREDEKDIFLDIACCFQGYELSKVLDILCAHHGDYVKLHIDVLIDKSLISISSDGKVTIHRLIEDMGKEVVRQEYPKEPGKRSRLWFPGDINHVLKNNTFFLYGIISLIVLTTVLFANQSSFFIRYVRYKITSIVVLILMAVYTYYYDKALNGEPEILSLVSNAAFALLSLSLSKLIKYERAMSIFSFSLGYLVVQLWTINWKLILVAICFGSPLFFMHSSSGPRHSSSVPRHSSSDSIQDQHVLDIEAS